MKHMTLPRFWQFYEQLPVEIRKVADKNLPIAQGRSFSPIFAPQEGGQDEAIMVCAGWCPLSSLGERQA